MPYKNNTVSMLYVAHSGSETENDMRIVRLTVPNRILTRIYGYMPSQYSFRVIDDKSSTILVPRRFGASYNIGTNNIAYIESGYVVDLKLEEELSGPPYVIKFEAWKASSGGISLGIFFETSDKVEADAELEMLSVLGQIRDEIRQLKEKQLW